MFAKKLMAILILVPILVVGVACGSSPAPRAKPSLVPAEPALTQVPGTPSPSTASATPSATKEPTFVDESDCMAACHVDEPNDNLAAGAKPQPPNHRGRTTCLSCHGTPATPPLPTTHVGRMDPSCVVCHIIEK